MAKYVYNKINFKPEHKKIFERILSECSIGNVHPDSKINKNGKFWRMDFEKIIPLPYYFGKLSTENSDRELIYEIRKEFNSYLDMINKIPNEDNIEIIIKNFIAYVKKSNHLSENKATKLNVSKYNFKSIEELFNLTAVKDKNGNLYSSNETILVLIDQYLEAKYGKSYFKQMYGITENRIVFDWRWLRFQLWGSLSNALYSKVKEDYILFETPYEFPRKIIWKLPDIVPEIPFKFHYWHEEENFERGFLKYIPNMKTEHNVAKVKYDFKNHDIEIIDTAYYKNVYDASSEWNAIMFKKDNGTLIIFDDWSDLNSKLWDLEEKEIMEKQKFWIDFSNKKF